MVKNSQLILPAGTQLVRNRLCTITKQVLLVLLPLQICSMYYLKIWLSLNYANWNPKLFRHILFSPLSYGVTSEIIEIVLFAHFNFCIFVHRVKIWK